MLLAILAAMAAAPAARAEPAATATAEPLDRDAVLERLQPVIGEPSRDLILDGDTLLDVAFRNRLGIEPLARLNPDVDIWIPQAGTIVRLPSRIVLPDADATGLVINVPEMRLFDFLVEEGEPEVFSAAIGDFEDPTPTGDFAIRDKRVDPVWTVPESIREEKPDLPPVVEAGPDNPLGSRWMRIGRTSYGIHGTNIRWSIGRRATHGCVRLYEADMQSLYERTPEGARLQIVYQPYKWGRVGNDIVLEAHPDVYARHPDRLAHALTPMRELGLLEHIDLERVWRTVEAAQGVPVVVGRLPEDLRP